LYRKIAYVNAALGNITSAKFTAKTPTTETVAVITNLKWNLHRRENSRYVLMLLVMAI
jgi:hypothetical protein